VEEEEEGFRGPILGRSEKESLAAVRCDSCNFSFLSLRSQSTEYLLLIFYHFSCGSAGRTVLWISAEVLGSYVDDIRIHLPAFHLKSTCAGCLPDAISLGALLALISENTMTTTPP
jgi:hypothetical protein